MKIKRTGAIEIVFQRLLAHGGVMVITVSGPASRRPECKIADVSGLLEPYRVVLVKTMSSLRTGTVTKRPRRFLSCVALMAMALQAAAGDLVTEGKYFACLSEQWLEDFTSFAVSKDFASIEAYLASNKCLVLKPNLTVTVADTPGLLETRTAFVIQGIRFYAPSEEIVLK